MSSDLLHRWKSSPPQPICLSQSYDLDRILILGGGGDKGEACDRRQEVEEEEASKDRRFCGSWRQMRKKVSLHQTHQLPLLQRVPAQKLDETRHLTLNTGPTALLAHSECVYVWFESLSSGWCLDRNSEINLTSIFCIACFWPRGQTFQCFSIVYEEVRNITNLNLSGTHILGIMTRLKLYELL